MIAVLLSLSLCAAPAGPAALSASDALNQGLMQYRNADFESAIPFFQRAVAATPDSDKPGKAKAEVWLGLAFLNIGNAELAKSSFRAALLADRGATLPDEAPPAATPMFANIGADLDRAAAAARPPPAKVQPKAESRPTAVAQRAPEVTKPMDDGVVPGTPDVPAASHDHDDVTSPPPDEGARAESSFHLGVPSWAPEATGGVAAALGVAAGGFKLASNHSFDNAEHATLATDSARYSASGTKQQKLALGMGIAAAGTVAVAVAMYLLNE